MNILKHPILRIRPKFLILVLAAAILVLLFIFTLTRDNITTTSWEPLSAKSMHGLECQLILQPSIIPLGGDTELTIFIRNTSSKPENIREDFWGLISVDSSSTSSKGHPQTLGALDGIHPPKDWILQPNEMIQRRSMIRTGKESQSFTWYPLITLTDRGTYTIRVWYGFQSPSNNEIVHKIKLVVF